jgi:hypothetical protein
MPSDYFADKDELKASVSTITSFSAEAEANRHNESCISQIGGFS